MRLPFAALIAVNMVLLAVGNGQAGPISLSLSSATDVNNLQVGTPVSFNVNLSGITPGDSSTYLSYLAATIQYDNTLLSSNPTVTAGAIVPDPNGFVGTGFPNAADGFYDGVFLASTPISQNGTFYSFTVTPLLAGNGTLTFSAAAATLASDPNQNDQFTPDSQSVNFQIGGTGPTPTPEPSSWVLGIIGVMALSGPFIRRVSRSLCNRQTGEPAVSR